MKLIATLIGTLFLGIVIAPAFVWIGTRVIVKYPEYVAWVDRTLNTTIGG